MAPVSFPPNYTEDGYLTVQVTTARGTVPLMGSTVSISTFFDGKQELYKVLTTDLNGQTEKVTLPAPPRTLSLKPGNEKPYATYAVEVDLTQYMPMANTNVHIFSGVGAILPFDMQPILDKGISREQIILNSDISDSSVKGAF